MKKNEKRKRGGREREKIGKRGGDEWCYFKK